MSSRRCVGATPNPSAALPEASAPVSERFPEARTSTQRAGRPSQVLPLLCPDDIPFQQVEAIFKQARHESPPPRCLSLSPSPCPPPPTPPLHARPRASLTLSLSLLQADRDGSGVLEFTEFVWLLG